MIWHDDIATRVEIDDASHRPLNLTHFAGNRTLTMMMPYCAHREARIDQRTAGEMAHLLDHFARHGQLPTSFPRHDYMI